MLYVAGLESIFLLQVIGYDFPPKTNINLSNKKISDFQHGTLKLGMKNESLNFCRIPKAWGKRKSVSKRDMNAFQSRTDEEVLLGEVTG